MRNSESFDGADPPFRRSRTTKAFGLLELRTFRPSLLAPLVLMLRPFGPSQLATRTFGARTPFLRNVVPIGAHAPAVPPGAKSKKRLGPVPVRDR